MAQAVLELKLALQKSRANKEILFHGRVPVVAMLPLQLMELMKTRISHAINAEMEFVTLMSQIRVALTALYLAQPIVLIAL